MKTSHLHLFMLLVVAGILLIIIIALLVSDYRSQMDFENYRLTVVAGDDGTRTFADTPAAATMTAKSYTDTPAP